MINDAVVGIITYQLRRKRMGAVEEVWEHSLDTLYAMPIDLLASGPIRRGVTEQASAQPDMASLSRLFEALAPQAKASVLAQMLAAIDKIPGKSGGGGPARADIARRLGAATRLAVHVVWRKDNADTAELACEVYKRLTRSAFSQTSPGLRIPTFLHDQPTFLSEAESRPLDPAHVEHSVFVVLLDNEMILNTAWRDCHHRMVELSEHDVAGTSLLPIALDTPIRAAPFDNMRVSHFTGDARPFQILIALEIHLLRVLAGGRADEAERKYARVFLSYATADGDKRPRAIYKIARDTPGVEPLLDSEILAPGDRFSKLERILPGTVLLAFLTPHYTSRAWCRTELLLAKKLGLPLVVVDAQGEFVSREFPYLGNAVWVKWQAGEQGHQRILEAATFEKLREQYVRLFLQDQTLMDAALSHAYIVTRPPELLDLVSGGSLASLAFQPPSPNNKQNVTRPATRVVLHPDPPLSAEELEILNSVAPGVRFVSPGLALAHGRPLLHPDGQSLRIGLSASPPDTSRAGVSELHFDDVWLDLNRLLLLGGSSVAFGGDLRPGGLTDLLLNLAEERAEIEKRAGLKRQVSIRSYLAWPLGLALTSERQAMLIDRVEFLRVSPPPSSAAVYPLTGVAPIT
ncbi:MAG: hypothetical protein Q8M07_22355, partial [Prosthecobacter sp.]|nr:hypothetical protein [Prosthecobacter sp.]